MTVVIPEPNPADLTPYVEQTWVDVPDGTEAPPGALREDAAAFNRMESGIGGASRVASVAYEAARAIAQLLAEQPQPVTTTQLAAALTALTADVEADLAAGLATRTTPAQAQTIATTAAASAAAAIVDGAGAAVDTLRELAALLQANSDADATAAGLLSALITTVGGKADSGALTAAIAGLAAVARTGSYSDLAGRPTIPSTPGAVGAEPAGAVAAAVTALAAVARTGSYADLSGRPTIPSTPGAVGAEPAGAVTTAIAALAAVARTGAYSDLGGKPDLSQYLTQTAASGTYQQVWRASTTYAAGAIVVSPAGQLISAKAAFTSGATFDASNWTVLADAVYGPGGTAGNLAASDLTRLLPKQPGPPVTLIAGTQAGHGFTVTTTGAVTSNLNDTSDPMLGTQAVSLTTATGAETDAFRRDVAVDLTGKGLVIYLKASNQSAGISKVDVQLPSGDGNFTGIIEGGVAYTAEQQYAKDGEWLRWFIPFSMISVGFRAGITGTTMSRAAITSVRVRFYNLAGQVVQASIAGIGTYPEPVATFPNGVVSFTYDDTGNSQFTAARVHLDKYGFRGTLYPILERVDASGYLTSAQIRHLHDRLGWEIGAHATTVASHGLGLTGMSAGQRVAELKTLRDWQVANGYADGATFAYPRGAFDAASMVDVSRHWVAARTVYGHCSEVIGTPYPYRLRCVNPSGFTLTQMKTLVDVAKQGRCWTIFCFHNLPATATDPVTDWALADHASLVDYVASSAVPVLPVAEVMQAAVPV